MRPCVNSSDGDCNTGGPRDHTLRYTDLLLDNLLQSHRFHDQQHALQTTLTSPPPGQSCPHWMILTACWIPVIQALQTPQTPFSD